MLTVFRNDILSHNFFKGPRTLNINDMIGKKWINTPDVAAQFMHVYLKSKILFS